MGNPSHSYGASVAIWDHRVLPATRHKWMRPTITPANQAGTWFTYPGGMEGWVDLGSLIAARPGIEPMISWSQVRCPNRYATKSPRGMSTSSTPITLKSLTSVIHDKGIRAVFLIICYMFQDVVHVHFKASNTEQSVIEYTWPDNGQHNTCNDSLTKRTTSVPLFTSVLKLLYSIF